MRGTYDFETSQWTRPIFIGLLWGPKGAREWASYCNKESPEAVTRFALENMRLLARFEGINEWWAHNGGNFDALILLEALDGMGWKIEAAPAQGGRIVRMTVRPAKGEKFTLLDSYAVIPSSLKNACKDFDLKARKLFAEEDYKDDMATLPRERLEAGCRADCEAVAELLETVETHLEEWGGKLKATFSSSALSCAKAAATESVGGWPVLDSRVNEFCRNGMYGGRVEVFRHTPKETLREYDVTSSYPWSMAQPVPWVFKRRLEAPKGLQWEGMCRARVTVPPMAIPPLPVKDERGGLYFPTGTWTGTYPTPELRYAQSLGCVVIPDVGYEFETAQPFADFVARAFHLKSTAKGAARQFGKLCLNGAYGKAGEKPEKEKLVIYPDEASAQAALVDAAAKGERVQVLSSEHSRFQLRHEFHWPKHTNFAMAAYITARSRILLHQHLMRAGPLLAYCDTDSIHGPKCAALEAEVNDALGGLKVEMKRLSAEYFAPKLYRLKNLDDGEEHLASKGFPVTAEAFARIIAGERVFRESLVKVKGQLRRKANKFTRLAGADMTFRSWGGKSAKRCPLPNGDTRPWTIKEIEAGAHLNAVSPLAKKLTPP